VPIARWLKDFPAPVCFPGHIDPEGYTPALGCTCHENIRKSSELPSDVNVLFMFSRVLHDELRARPLLRECRQGDHLDRHLAAVCGEERTHSVMWGHRLSVHFIARAPARGNLPSTATGDCFVVALLAMTGSRRCSFPHVSEWTQAGLRFFLGSFGEMLVACARPARHASEPGCILKSYETI
jgi:hypothetical protein